MNRISLSIALFGLVAAVAPLGAQGRGRNTNGVPPGHLPPPGMCRIWIDGVPPGQQPAPTDCATAVRNRPANGRVLFGDDGFAGKGKGRWKRGAAGERAFGARNDEASDDRGGWHRDRSASTLPEMIGAILIGQGRRTADVARWLGAGEVVARSSGVRNGTPGRVTWLDATGRVLQVWTDANHDGRADRVEVYERGRLARVIQ